MLKHNDIISQLSERDKITLLSDLSKMSGELHERLDMPAVNVGNIEDFCANELPSPTAMANSWNMQLIGKVAQRSAKNAKLSGKNFLEIPGPKAKINPYRHALSEDPLLASAVSEEYLNAADREKIACGIRGFGILRDETEFLDEKPDAQFIHKYLTEPFSRLADNTECIAVLPEKDLADAAYNSVNFSLLKDIEAENICRGKYALYNSAATDKTVTYMQHGATLINGSALALESALNNYKKIQNGIVHGTATTEKLNEEVTSGKAISPDAVDLALDRLLDFAFDVNKISMTESCDNVDADIALRAMLESVVLLKNSNSLLPLKKHLKICAIGDIVKESETSFIDSLKDYIEAKGDSFIGYSQGYDIDRDRSPELILSAVNLAREADVVLLFLGLGAKRAKKAHKTRKISIPANQQELLYKLGTMKERIVAIMPPEASIDVAIPNNCAAIMHAPLNLSCSARAIAMIISGDFSPCGKLASTVYVNTDKEYIEYKTHRLRDRLKVGQFIGYRYYDTAGAPQEFPFGHGLGYVKFEYSKLKLSNGTATFTVKNCSKRAGSEIAQVYMGRTDTGVLRPEKELCAFTKIHLSPKEKKTVTLKFDIPKVFDPSSSTYTTEFGDYTVYVGSSLSDIRLQGSITDSSGEILSDNAHLSDYIHTKSNITKDNFKLEAAIPTMKRSIFNIVAGAVALALALILKMYCFFEGLSTGFLDWFSITLAGAGIVFFVVEAVRRSRIDAEEKHNLDKINEENFKEAEQISNYSAGQMFAEEFDMFSEDIAHEMEIHSTESDSNHFSYIDKEQSFEIAAREFELFAYERGVKFSHDAVRKLFASISASRLVVINGMLDEDFGKMMLMLSNYFETAPYIDTVDDTYLGSGRVLFNVDEYGNRTKTHVNLAVEAAGKVPQSIHFAALTNVKPENLPIYFNPFVNYAKNPLGACYIPVVNDKNIETSFYLPQNVWFVLNLAEGESADNLPDYIAEIATVNMMDILPCESAAQHSHVHPFSFYQLDYLSEKVSSKFSIDEDTWKKIDHLEEYVNDRAEFKIGNKMWLCLEKYAYVFMACGGDKDSAIDEAVSAKLVPTIMSVLKNVLSADDMNLSDTVEMILGEERAEACKALIYACELAAVRAAEEAYRIEEEALAAEQAEAEKMAEKLAEERAEAESLAAEREQSESDAFEILNISDIDDSENEEAASNEEGAATENEELGAEDTDVDGSENEDEITEVEEIQDKDEITEAEEIQDKDEIAEAEEIQDKDEITEAEELQDKDEIAEAEELQDKDEIAENEESENKEVVLEASEESDEESSQSEEQ